MGIPNQCAVVFGRGLFFLTQTPAHYIVFHFATYHVWMWVARLSSFLSSHCNGLDIFDQLIHEVKLMAGVLSAELDSQGWTVVTIFEIISLLKLGSLWSGVYYSMKDTQNSKRQNMEHFMWIVIFITSNLCLSGSEKTSLHSTIPVCVLNFVLPWSKMTGNAFFCGGSIRSLFGPSEGTIQLVSKY